MTNDREIRDFTLLPLVSGWLRFFFSLVSGWLHIVSLRKYAAKSAANGLGGGVDKFQKFNFTLDDELFARTKWQKSLLLFGIELSHVRKYSEVGNFFPQTFISFPFYFKILNSVAVFRLFSEHYSCTDLRNDYKTALTVLSRRRPFFFLFSPVLFSFPQNEEGTTRCVKRYNSLLFID